MPSARAMALGALALLASWRVGVFIDKSGELRSLSNLLAYTGRCERTDFQEIGFEDFAAFDKGRVVVALASQHMHFAFRFGVSMRTMLKQNPHHEVHARILRGGTWQSLTLRDAPTDFAPHGIAGWGSFGSSDARLLVVNHRTTHDTLELFAADRFSSARHLRTVSHPLLFNINDCVFASASAVYCTNWRQYETGTLADAIEVYGQQPWSYAVACVLAPDAVSCELVAQGMRMANGIELRGDLVFIVESLAPAIRVYRRTSEETLGLEFAYSIETRAACDNLMWHGDSLLTACHPHALTFVRYSKAPRQHTSPCEVLRFDGVASNASRWEGRPHGEVIYLDAIGNEYSACTVAAIVEDVMWLGAVHDKGLLRCHLH